MIKATMRSFAYMLLGVMITAGLSNQIIAQDAPSLGEEFIFFINGANVQIPTLGGAVVADPLDPTSSNRVFEIGGGGWSEAGFTWNRQEGVDASAMIGTNYGESDTLYIRFLSSEANRFQNDFIAFMDKDDGVMNPATNPDSDLPFRIRWTIPAWAHDGEWHDLAIPLPPATAAQLDSAKAGVTFAGDSLEVEVDSLFMNWNYAGAWAAGDATGHWDQSDPFWDEFQWDAVAYFGRHVDYADGGAPFYFDYWSIGVAPENLVDTAPAALPSISVENVDGSNTVSWAAATDVGGYNVYFSESEITSVVDPGVSQLGTIASDGTLSYDHSLLAPHPSYGNDFTAYYAVTALSNFGSESDPAASSITANLESRANYVVEIATEGVDAVFTALENDAIPEASALASFFPDTYVPFEINEATRIRETGAGGLTDDDISAKYWIGFDPVDDLLIVYAEVTDDITVFASEATGSGGAWNFDSWEMAIGNYTPESFIQGSDHGVFEGGEEPDWQFRGGMMSDRAPFAHANGGGNAFSGEVPNSQTIGETTDNGYRLLTVYSMIELSGGDSGDKAFDFPSGTDISLYPMNVTINDNDETSRDAQWGWSDKGGQDDWWNNPTRWTVVAFVGSGAVVSNENEGSIDSPREFSLDQNYPNPFNPATNISFSLPSTSDVTLEVFNMLGQKVATLLQGEKMNAGAHTQKFDASSLSSGMYLYRLSTPSFVQSRKMMLIK
ncbi:MAG: hypothetical protein BalsKO_31520 [Balneolaceae bacterium]